MKFFVAVTIALAFSCALADKPENNTFIATKDWQEIRESQGIPAGLHVRINLQTGKKEAKLLDEEDKGPKKSGDAALAAIPENGSEVPTKGTAKHKLKISKTLTNALKQLPKDGLALEYSPEKLEQIKRDYKSYKELKDSYNDMRKNFKSDAEIITQLLGEFRNLSKNEDPTLSTQSKITTQLRILEDFNYLAHQIDNALWFVDEGGLDQVLLPLVVNQTHTGLRVQAMRVLGALTVNNPKAQIKVFERNFGSHLSQILLSSTNTEELSTALYAFGSLLRKFPHAQQRILATSGTQALIAVMSKECELKIKAKAATLVSDIIVEKQFVLAAEEDPVAAAQYAEINFSDWLKTNSYCETLDTLISTRLYELLEQPDMTEYFVHALQNTEMLCAPLWSQSPQFRHTLLTLKNRFMHSKEEYRMEVAQQLQKLVSTLYENGTPHDEL